MTQIVPRRARREVHGRDGDLHGELRGRRLLQRFQGRVEAADPRVLGPERRRDLERSERIPHVARDVGHNASVFYAI